MILLKRFPCVLSEDVFQRNRLTKRAYTAIDVIELKVNDRKI